MEGDNKQDLAAAQRQRILSAGKKITANDVAGLGRLWVWLGLMGGGSYRDAFCRPSRLVPVFPARTYIPNSSIDSPSAPTGQFPWAMDSQMKRR
jgi:hypothetical protein